MNQLLASPFAAYRAGANALREPEPTYQTPERDNALRTYGGPTIAAAEAMTPNTLAADADFIRYANQGAVRNLPLSERLVAAMGFLPGMGIEMEVFSGGQPVKGSGKPRVGSVRHDNGDAADVFFYRGGEMLDWRNPDHIPVLQEIVRQSKAAGLTGFGAGPGYMRPGSMHIGYGTPAVWGDEGKGVNAPNWLRQAYYG